MAYELWNEKLFEYFFNEENEGSHVICYVDIDVIDEVGKDLGGLDSFLESIVIYNDSPQHISRRLEHLVCDESDCDTCQTEIPPYFAMLCFTVLVWTLDTDLHSSNYYGRLNNLLAPVYKAHGVSPEKFKLGNTSLTNKFRPLLDEMFRLLEYHTFVKLDGCRGYTEYRSMGSNYVDVPRVHALLNAKDKQKLELFFSLQGLTPGALLEPDKIQRLFPPDILRPEYLRQATINEWNKGQDSRDIISQIISSLLIHWDGTYEISSNGNNASTSQKQSSVSLKVAFARQLAAYSLGWRLEFATQDFPLGQIELKIGKEIFSISRQIGGWSYRFDVGGNLSSSLLSPTKKTPLKCSGGNIVRLFNKPIVFLAQDLRLGDYVPLQSVNVGTACLVFAEEKSANTFLEANREILRELNYQPKIEGWNLYSANEGLVSCDGVRESDIRPPDKAFELYGGVKIGHAASRKYSVLVPPQVKFLNVLLPDNKVVYQHGDKEAPLEIQGEGLYGFPTENLDSGNYQIYLVDSQGNIIEECETIGFQLLDCEMPNNEDFDGATEVLQDVGCDYLYNVGNFQLSLLGNNEIDHRLGNYRGPSVESPLIIKPGHNLRDLTVCCDSKKLLSCQGLGNTEFRIDSLAEGKHELRAVWHGLEIENKIINIINTPAIDVSIEGVCVESECGRKKIYAKDNSKFVFKIDRKDSSEILVYVDGDFFRKIESKFEVFSCDVCSFCEIEFRWFGETIYSLSFDYVEVPDLVIDVDQYSGMNWPESEVYDPNSPPEFNLITEDEDFVFQEGVKFHLGNCPLDIKKISNGNTKLFIAEGHQVTGKDLKVEMNIHGSQFSAFRCQGIHIEQKPSCEIKLDGGVLTDGNYSSSIPPKIRLTNKNRNIHVYVADIEVHREPSGFYIIPPNVIRNARDEGSVLIQTRWFGVPLYERKISFTKANQADMKLIGGTKINKVGKDVFLKNSCPTAVEVSAGKVDLSLEVLFGVAGKSKTALTHGEGTLYELNEFTAKASETYELEVWQSGVKVTTLRHNVCQ